MGVVFRIGVSILSVTQHVNPNTDGGDLALCIIQPIPQITSGFRVLGLGRVRILPENARGKPRWANEIRPPMLLPKQRCLWECCYEPHRCYVEKISDVDLKLIASRLYKQS